MWRLPQRLWLGPVLKRVADFAGEGWDRCEWCDGRPGFPARRDDGVWQFVCPECAEPWHHVPYGVGLMELARDLGGLWWFGGSGVASAGTSRMRAEWSESSGYGGGSADEGFLVVESVFVWVDRVGDGVTRGARLEERRDSLGAASVDEAAMALQPGAPAVGNGDGRDRTWDERDEAVQLQNALRDEGRRRGYGRWHSIGDLVGRFRRLRDFSMEDLWTAATLAHRNGTKRFDCFWERGQDGGWEEIVLLRPEHERNREGR